MTDNWMAALEVGKHNTFNKKENVGCEIICQCLEANLNLSSIEQYIMHMYTYTHNMYVHISLRENLIMNYLGKNLFVS
jgi:hypothetical protein